MNQINGNYERIEKAIRYISRNINKQPDLNEVAGHVCLSPFHFQRLFNEWAGVSPKKFLQYLSVEYAKRILTEKENTLFDAAELTGLSGTGRLHDLFVNIEGMTPGEYKSGGEQLQINYSYADTLFGTVQIASTQKGICHLSFIDNKNEALKALKEEYPGATFSEAVDSMQTAALKIYRKDWKDLQEIKLHLKGTEFQLKVWKSLLSIPLGKLSSYGKIAGLIGAPKASRAVGTAIGSNPVAFLIPCHRVVQATGNYGEYRWGSLRKKALIGWEAASVETEKDVEGSVREALTDR